MKAKQILYAAIIGLVGQYVMAASPAYRTLRDIDFENYTYRYADQEFQVEGGRYESAEDDASIESLDVINIKFGPLTQTQQENVVVLTRYNGGGTGLFDTLHVFKLSKGRPVLVDVLEAGDRASGGIKSFYIENGALYVTSYDGEQNACNTCYDYERTTGYKWNGHELAVIWKSEPQPTSEPEAQGEEEEDGGEVESEAPSIDIADAADAAADASLAECLGDPRDRVRIQALEIIKETKDSRYFEKLVTALNDSQPRVRSAAIMAIAEMSDGRAVDSLIQALDDKNWDIRTDALWVLGELGNTQSAAMIMQVYEEAMTEGQGRAGDEAVEALGKIRAEQAMPVLIAALEQSNPDRRSTAARALGELGNKSAILALESVLNAETRPYVRADIESALQRLALK